MAAETALLTQKRGLALAIGRLTMPAARTRGWGSFLLRLCKKPAIRLPQQNTDRSTVLLPTDTMLSADFPSIEDNRALLMESEEARQNLPLAERQGGDAA